MNLKILVKAVIKCYLLLCIILSSGFSIAHPGHGEKISEEELVLRAKFNIKRLVEKNKLEGSWEQHAQFQSVAKRYVGEEVEFALEFSNPKLHDAKKRVLYVYLTASGDYIAANFSGK